ncbi:MAG: 3-deoxy-manno-octulosonate cytidylyltransferase [Thermodesulfobacteriota bacterium]
MAIYGIIPARLGSTRLPSKILADIAGKPMIQWVYERAKASPFLDRLIVATDHEDILNRVQSFGGEVVMTSPAHPSGTDRICEAAQKLGVRDEDIVVNIQGDQPLFEPGMIAEVVSPLQEDRNIQMSALVYPIQNQADLLNPSVVKVVFDKSWQALYFSRSPMPYVISEQIKARYYKHIGPYAYRMAFLVKFIKLERGYLEQLESLEQLRALEHGYKIKLAETKFDSWEIDTWEDLEKVRAMVEKTQLKRQT